VKKYKCSDEQGKKAIRKAHPIASKRPGRQDGLARLAKAASVTQ